MRRLVRFGGLAIVFLITSFSAAQGPDKKPSSSVSKKADPSGTGPLMGQLRALFAQWDANQDEILDKEELAHGFRGAEAKPPTTATGKTKSGESNSAGKARNGSKEGSTFPDRDFLQQVDQNGDGRVSRDEFLNWAREYAVHQKNIAAAEKRVSKAEVKVRSRTTANARAQAEL